MNCITGFFRSSLALKTPPRLWNRSFTSILLSSLFKTTRCIRALAHKKKKKNKKKTDFVVGVTPSGRLHTYTHTHLPLTDLYIALGVWLLEKPMTFSFFLLCFRNNSNCWETYKKVFKKEMYTSDAVPHENQVLAPLPPQKVRDFFSFRGEEMNKKKTLKNLSSSCP